MLMCYKCLAEYESGGRINHQLGDYRKWQPVVTSNTELCLWWEDRWVSAGSVETDTTTHAIAAEVLWDMIWHWQYRVMYTLKSWSSSSSNSSSIKCSKPFAVQLSGRLHVTCPVLFCFVIVRRLWQRFDVWFVYWHICMNLYVSVCHSELLLHLGQWHLLPVHHCRLLVQLPKPRHLNMSLQHWRTPRTASRSFKKSLLCIDVRSQKMRGNSEFSLILQHCCSIYA